MTQGTTKLRQFLHFVYGYQPQMSHNLLYIEKYCDHTVVMYNIHNHYEHKYHILAQFSVRHCCMVYLVANSSYYITCLMVDLV